MEDRASALNQRIAGRVRQLRAERALSLELLAEQSGVSRSMISLIERGETSPTAVVLERLASGLGVSLASLFDTPAAAAAQSETLARRKDQAEWQDPSSGYRRRSISPPGTRQPVRIAEVKFPAGARVAFENGAIGVRVHQQIWVLEGVMEVSVDQERHRLREGDCLAMKLDGPTVFHNPTRKAARYAVVVATEAVKAR
jgi:transcriptional regulator with XRE-family HTH domain